MSALTSDFPSLMSSLMNLLVLSSSASCDLSVSRKCGLSRQQSLNSSAGSPMVSAAPRRGARLPRGPGGPQPRARTRRDPGRLPRRPPAPQVWRRLALRAVSAGAHDFRTEPGLERRAAAPAACNRAAGEQEAQRRTRSGAGKGTRSRASAAASSPPPSPVRSPAASSALSQQPGPLRRRSDRTNVLAMT